MLGIEYYGFAFFVAALVCLIAILCKYLFADVKRQSKLLDEKESKLLRLYQSVEDVLDGFSDQAAEAREEIKRLVNGARACQDEVLQARAEALAAIDAAGTAAARGENNRAQAEAGPKSGAKRGEEPAAADKRKAAKSGARTEGGVSFQKIIDELDGDSAQAGPEERQKSGRNEAILALKAEGKSVAKIAQELGITQNEVKLVIGLNK